MKKSFKAVVSAIALALTVMSASAMATAAAPALPDYESSQLSAEQLDTMFDPDGYTYPGAPHQDLVRAIYAKLDDPSKSVYGMNFTATETYEQASAAEYADYLVDFELSADKPTSVLLAGNYGEYGTIALGIVNVTPEEPVRVMELVYQLIPDIKFTYKDVVSRVKSFDCAAIPVSSELLKAYYAVKCEDPAYQEANPVYTDQVEAALLSELEELNPIQEDLAVTEDSTTLGLALKLYETDAELNETGESWQVGETASFTYTAEAENDLPDYDSHVLSKAELDKLFAEQNFTYDEGAQKLLAQVYANLPDPEKNAFGVNFKATETYDEADAARYGDYIADFELASDKPVSVLLAGNYGDYGTIALGIVNVTSEPTRIMQLFDQLTGKGKLTYKEVVSMVGSFDCAAIPLSTELLKAYYTAKCENDPVFKEAYPAYGKKAEAAILAEFVTDYNPAGAQSFAVAGNDTSLTLTLKLYENDPAGGKYDETDKSWAVGSSNTFTYEKAQTADPVISDSLLVIHNMADVEKDGVFYHPIHIYAGIDTLDCENVGLEIKVENGTESEEQTTSTTTVYNTMNVTDSEGEESVYSAEKLGGKYIFGNQILLNADKWKNEDTTILVTPYAVKLDGTIIQGGTTTITDALIKAQDAESSLFREEQ